MHLLTLIVLILAIVFNALANILMKASAVKSPGADLIRSVLNPYFIAGLACFGLALIAYRHVLGQGMKLSLAYPIMTTAGFAIVLFASHYFFNEALNLTQWAGIGLLVVGLWLVASQM